MELPILSDRGALLQIVSSGYKLRAKELIIQPVRVYFPVYFFDL